MRIVALVLAIAFLAAFLSAVYYAFSLSNEKTALEKNVASLSLKIGDLGRALDALNASNSQLSQENQALDGKVANLTKTNSQLSDSLRQLQAGGGNSNPPGGKAAPVACSSYMRDRICPSQCKTYDDNDCCLLAGGDGGMGTCIVNGTDIGCLEKGFQWIADVGCYTNTTSSPPPSGLTNKDCSGGTPDQICAQWCSAGADYDCCIQLGKHWIAGRGCYS